MKRKKLLIIFCLCLFLFTSCRDTKRSGIQEDMERFTSSEYEGRFYGSKGNDKTALYISKVLKQNEYKQLEEDNFIIPFKEKLPIIKKTSLIIDNDKKITLTEGTDYIYSVIEPVHLQGVISKENSDNKIEIETDKNISLILSESDYRAGNGTKIAGMEKVKSVELGLTKKAMDIVKENEGKQIEFVCEGEKKEVKLSNVIGVLPGKNRKRAIIVGAHFDHMGKIGDTLYSGAVDNASGFCSLLAISKKLSGKIPKTDIVFTFWNGEEIGLLGSKAMARQFDERYEEYCYINIDSIGMKDTDIVISTNNLSGALSKELCNLLKKNGYKTKTDEKEYMPSDHMSFTDCSAVNLGHRMDRLNSVIHRPSDTIEHIDIEELEQFSSAMAKVLNDSCERLLEAGKYTEGKSSKKGSSIVMPEGNYLDMTPKEQSEYKEKIRGQLAYDEYFLLQTGKNNFIIIYGKDGVIFDSLKKAERLYAGLQVKETLGKYKLVQTEIYSDGKSEEDEEAGKVLKRSFSTDRIFKIVLFYKKGKECLIYTEDFNQDVNQMIKSYEGKKEKVVNKENAWVIYDEINKMPREYVTGNSKKCISVFQGPISRSENGQYYRYISNEKRYNKKTLKELIKLAEKNAPVIIIDN